MKVYLVFIVFLITLTGQGPWTNPWTLPLMAQQADEQDEKALKAKKEREKFLSELETLIKAARDSGFSEQEIREISITRKGKTINVWEHLEQERMRQEREERRRFVPRERYLNVMDITGELESLETSKLDELRKKMVFVGAQQK